MPLASVTAHWLNGWGQTDESGGAPGAYILGGRGTPVRPRRQRKKIHKEPLINVDILDVAPIQVIIDEPLLMMMARQRVEDELLLVGIL